MSDVLAPEQSRLQPMVAFVIVALFCGAVAYAAVRFIAIPMVIALFQ